MNAKQIRSTIRPFESVVTVAKLSTANKTLVVSTNVSAVRVSAIDLDTGDFLWSPPFQDANPNPVQTQLETATLPDTGSGAETIEYTFAHELTRSEVLTYTGSALLVEYQVVMTDGEFVHVGHKVTVDPTGLPALAVVGVP